MIAYVLHGKRDLRAEERPSPADEPGNVLIEVHHMGICGSDVHYYAEGYCGAFVPKRPFVLGHEVSGTIASTSDGVEGLAVGQRVAVDPSRPCGVCRYCRDGRSNLCPDMQYLGSASTDPHVDGAFSTYVSVPADRCHVLPDDVEDAEAAMLEPLSVATHAVMRAGSVAGKSVLILGAGTMGQLVLQVASAMGADGITMTDVRQQALELARKQGAHRTCLAGRASKELSPAFDVIIEASGAPAALRTALELAGRGGTVVQLGTLPSRVELPAHLIMQKELQVLGSFRFADVFSQALELMAARRIDVRPLITHTFPFGDLVRAFETALEDESAMKIQVRR